MDTISKNIYEKIVELSDIELQRKMWLNEHNDTGLISSYTETMCALFDDYCFDNFIDKTALKNGLSSKIVIELGILRNLLNNYKEKESDAAILVDPKWFNIVNQAKQVIDIWNIESPDERNMLHR